MKSKLWLLVTLLFCLGFMGMKTSLDWCKKPMQQGESAFDTDGNFFVLDGNSLRKFRDQEVAKNYLVRKNLACVMSGNFKNFYSRGEDIDFSPEQDFEKSKIFKVRGKMELFIWFEDQVFQMKKGFKPSAYWEEFFSEISEFQWQNLPKSKRLMDKNLLAALLAKRRSSQAQFKEGSLLYSLNRERIYLVKSGKRYRFWSSVSLLRLGYGKDKAKKISASVLYSIPFGGYIF